MRPGRKQNKYNYITDLEMIMSAYDVHHRRFFYSFLSLQKDDYEKGRNAEVAGKNGYDNQFVYRQARYHFKGG